MEYGKIIAVTGLPGLFELLSSKNDGAIVRSLEDKTSRFVSSRVHNFSHLESIEVFTVRDNVNLVEIFHAMEKEADSIPDNKDGAALKKYFEKVYPELDFERVYTSDLKKMVKWFEVLKANNVEIKLTAQEEQPAEAEEPAETEEKSEAPATPSKKKAKAGEEEPEGVKEAAPKKAAAKKKAEPKSTEASADTEEKPAKAPAKKSAPKKK